MTRSDFFQSVLGAAVAPQVENIKTVDLGSSADEERLFAIVLGSHMREEGHFQIGRALEPLQREFHCKFIICDPGTEIKRVA